MKKNDIFYKIKEKMKTMYNKNKKIFIATIALCIVLIVLVFSVIFSPKKQSKNEQSDSQKTSSISEKDYASYLETKLRNMILQIKEVQSVSVMVTTSSPKTEFLKQTKTETKMNGNDKTETVTEEIVFEKNGSNSTPVVVSNFLPEVVGVLIVTNKVSPLTKISIISSVAVVLNIDESRISFLQEG